MLIIGGPVVRRLRFQDSRRQPVDRDQQMVSQCGEFDTCPFSSTNSNPSDWAPVWSEGFVVVQLFLMSATVFDF